MIAVIIFVIILGLLVLVHEFGHFIVAKKSGMLVEEFGIGFPPRLFSFKKGETKYSFNLIPLGGFVKILGENNKEGENPRSFINKSFFSRFSTLVAGVLMNFVLAWVLFSIGFGIGLPTVIQSGETLPKYGTLRSEAVTILEVAPNSPAEKAGIRAGDNILGADEFVLTGQGDASVDQFIVYVKSKAGTDVQMHVRRGSEELYLTINPRLNPPPEEGAIGIALGNVGKLSFPWYLAPVMGLKATGNVISGTASAFWNLIAHGEGLSSVGGPVKIASLTGQVSKLGFAYILQFAAFLSVNLGILNIVPFPALDGGRVLFLIIEKIRGKRNNETFEQYANAIGFGLLIMLILVITARDIKGLF
ncbi:MAG: RIP metalloprotease RseP [Patescibacteria group bacterium]